MLWKEYRDLSGPPLTRAENVTGTVKVCAFIALWLVGTLITRNGDWLDKWVTRPVGEAPGSELPSQQEKTT